MKKIVAVCTIVLLVGITAHGELNVAEPSSYSAPTWFLGPHLNKYRKSDELVRINAMADLDLSDDEFVVRMGVDLLDINKVPGFFSLLGRAFKAEPIETPFRALVNLGTVAVVTIGAAEGMDALGITDIDILDQDDDRPSGGRPSDSGGGVPSDEQGVDILINDNKGEVTIRIGDGDGDTS